MTVWHCGTPFLARVFSLRYVFCARILRTNPVVE